MNVLMAINKQFTHRPSIRKLKEKRVEDKRKLRIVVGLFMKKKKRTEPMSEKEAATIIGRYIRQRQKNKVIDPIEIN